MSATILAFPNALRSDAGRYTADLLRSETAPISAIALARKFIDHFLPVVQVSVDLLEADERDFELRCTRMVDADGTAMIEDLCEELQIVGRQMKLLVDGLERTQARLRTAETHLSAAWRQNEGAERTGLLQSPRD